MYILIESAVLLLTNVVFLWLIHCGHYFEKYWCRNLFPEFGNADRAIVALVWLFQIAYQILIAAGCYIAGADLVNGSQMLILAAALFYLALTDMERKILPNALLGALAVIKILAWIGQAFTNGFPTKNQILYQVIYTFAALLLLMMITVVSKGGFGYGDVKLLTVLTLYLDYGMLLSTLLVALLSALVVSFYLLSVKKADRKRTIPFGPFLYVGYVVNSLLILCNR